MANVEHSALTGSNLHEPKGVSSATAGQIYIADGLGSGSWTTAGQTSLASAAKAFEAQLLHVRDEKASGTDAGTFTSGSWTKRTLNTSVTNQITSASLASDQITLPAGTYFIIAKAPAIAVTKHKTKLRNVTDGSDTLNGSSEHTENAVTTWSWIVGQFTIAGAKVFEFQHICSTTNAGDGLGLNTSMGNVEVYAEVMIWKVA